MGNVSHFTVSLPIVHVLTNQLLLGCSDFADDFTNAEVIGTDVSPIQPSWVPPNVKFELDDCNREWTWNEDSFDFIHLRMLIGVISNWSDIFRNAFRCARSGAYVESMVSSAFFRSDDGSVKKGSALEQWHSIFWEGGKKLGRTFKVLEDDLQKKAMEEAGFVDIAVKDIKIPLGAWSEDKKLAEIGLWWKMSLEEDLEGKFQYFSVLCWPLTIFRWIACTNPYLQDTLITSVTLCWVGLQRRLRHIVPMSGKSGMIPTFTAMSGCAWSMVGSRREKGKCCKKIGASSGRMSYSNLLHQSGSGGYELEIHMGGMHKRAQRFFLFLLCLELKCLIVYRMAVPGEVEAETDGR